MASNVQIPLTQGKVALVDFEDLPLIEPYKWRAYRNWRTWYAAATTPRPEDRTLSMHRVILGLEKGGPHVDHKNGKGLDNRRSNLRLATALQNNRNRRPDAGTSSMYKGVSRHTYQPLWIAKIQIDGRRIFLGHFVEEIEAAKAYDRAASEHFKDFAYLNFADEG